MKVIGTLKQEITVDISPKEAFNALADSFNLKRVFDDNRDGYWSKTQSDDKKGEYLQYYENTAYHGSPVYEPVKTKVITHPDIIKAYDCLSQLKELMK